MILKTAHLRDIRNPSEEMIEDTLRSLLVDDQVEFVILVAAEEENFFMQTIAEVGEAGAEFVVEYRIGKQHHRVQKTSLEATIDLFKCYQRHNNSWMESVEWEDISEEMDKYAISMNSAKSASPVASTISPDRSRTVISPAVKSDSPNAALGVVYLIMAGPFYKIGKTTNLEQRIGQIRLQLPYPVQVIHTIKTDDISGIEIYWHKRFADRRTNGEWFILTNSDVDAFKSRLRM